MYRAGEMKSPPRLQHKGARPLYLQIFDLSPQRWGGRTNTHKLDLKPLAGLKIALKGLFLIKPLKRKGGRAFIRGGAGFILSRLIFVLSP